MAWDFGPKLGLLLLATLSRSFLLAEHGLVDGETKGKPYSQQSLSVFIVESHTDKSYIALAILISMSPLSRCAKCNQYVEGEVVSALGNTFHQRCFRCHRSVRRNSAVQCYHY